MSKHVGSLVSRTPRVENLETRSLLSVMPGLGSSGEPLTANLEAVRPLAALVDSVSAPRVGVLGTPQGLSAPKAGSDGLALVTPSGLSFSPGPLGALTIGTSAALPNPPEPPSLGFAFHTLDGLPYSARPLGGFGLDTSRGLSAPFGPVHGLSLDTTAGMLYPSGLVGGFGSRAQFAFQNSPPLPIPGPPVPFRSDTLSFIPSGDAVVSAFGRGPDHHYDPSFEFAMSPGHPLPPIFVGTPGPRTGFNQGSQNLDNSSGFASLHMDGEPGRVSDPARPMSTANMTSMETEPKPIGPPPPPVWFANADPMFQHPPALMKDGMEGGPYESRFSSPFLPFKLDVGYPPSNFSLALASRLGSDEVFASLILSTSAAFSRASGSLSDSYGPWLSKEFASPAFFAVSLPISIMQGAANRLSIGIEQVYSLSARGVTSILVSTVGLTHRSTRGPSGPAAEVVELIDPSALPTQGSDLFSWNTAEDCNSIEEAVDRLLERLGGVDAEKDGSDKADEQTPWPAVWTAAVVSLEVSRRWLGIGDRAGVTRPRSKRSRSASTRGPLSKFAGWPGSWSSRFP